MKAKIDNRFHQLEVAMRQAQSDIKKLAKAMELNKQAIIKLENESEQPKLKQLDQSVFDGLDENFTCAAVDGNGKGFAYSHSRELRASSVYDGWVGYVHHCYLGDFDASDWQNSLIERESKELTGSDLCRAMLERGDKYISGFGHHHSDAAALDNKFADTVSKYTQCFQSSQNAWDYFVPINNQGEPLTASEVGL